MFTKRIRLATLPMYACLVLDSVIIFGSYLQQILESKVNKFSIHGVVFIPSLATNNTETPNSPYWSPGNEIIPLTK